MLRPRRADGPHDMPGISGDVAIVCAHSAGLRLGLRGTVLTAHVDLPYVRRANRCRTPLAIATIHRRTAMAEPKLRGIHSPSLPNASNQLRKQGADVAQAQLDAATKELSPYKPLIELARAAESRRTTVSTRFSWAHPLGLVIRS